jgi:Ni/Fe-hydrogenase subunit HybB-like protein
MALEGLKPYLYERFPLRKWEDGIYRRLPLEKMGLFLDSGDAELRWARIFGVLSLLFAFLAYTVEGSLFAHVEARPFWYGVLYPFDFFIGACFCGVAWLLAMGIITYKAKGEEIPSNVGNLYFEMAQLLALFLSAGLIFTAYKMGHGLFEPSKARTITLFLNGPFSNAFWIFEIAIGAVFPILLLLYAARTRRINGVLVASVMVLVGYFVKRYDFVVGSQVYPLIKQPYPQFSYLPTSMEVLLIGGIVGALLLAYTLGVKFLPLEEKHLPNAH